MIRNFHRAVSGLFLVATFVSVAALICCAMAAQTVRDPQPSTPIRVSPMPLDADPTFEVATIKPSDTSSPHGSFFTTRGRHLIAYNMSVGSLLTYAYGVHEKQILGIPSSLLEIHFDIDGLPDIEGRPNTRQSRLLYQKLLVARFRLTFHRERRELPAYLLVVANDGPKLTRTTRKPGDGSTFSSTRQIVLTVRNQSMADFAHGMQEAFLDKPVVDQTGLGDRYDFELKWTPDEYQTYGPNDPAPPSNDPNAPPGLFTAIREQLGLKFVPAKATVEAMVIDHIESPTGN